MADAKADEVLEVFADVPSTEIEAERFAAPGIAIAEVMATTGLASSKGEAARLIKGGGVYLNDARVTDERGRITLEQAIDGRLLRAAQGPAEPARGADQASGRVESVLGLGTRRPNRRSGRRSAGGTWRCG